MSKHTKEPWNGKEIRISIPEMEQLNVSVAFTGRGVESDANARRIVACVNALAGVPTEWLEKFSVDGSENVAQENARLAKQLDELLYALKKIASVKPSLMHDENQREVIVYSPYYNPFKIARDAIADKQEE